MGTELAGLSKEAFMFMLILHVFVSCHGVQTRHTFCCVLSDHEILHYGHVPCTLVAWCSRGGGRGGEGCRGENSCLRVILWHETGT